MNTRRVSHRRMLKNLETLMTFSHGAQLRIVTCKWPRDARITYRKLLNLNGGALNSAAISTVLNRQI